MRETGKNHSMARHLLTALKILSDMLSYTNAHKQGMGKQKIIVMCVNMYKISLEEEEAEDISLAGMSDTSKFEPGRDVSFFNQGLNWVFLNLKTIKSSTKNTHGFRKLV